MVGESVGRPDIESGGETREASGSNAGGDVFKTGSSMSVERSLRLLVVASTLKKASGKVTIMVQEDHDEMKGSMSAVAAILSLVGLLGLLRCLRGRCAWLRPEREEPSVRALPGAEDRDNDDWSLISDLRDRHGLRVREAIWSPRSSVGPPIAVEELYEPQGIRRR